VVVTSHIERAYTCFVRLVQTEVMATQTQEVLDQVYVVRLHCQNEGSARFCALLEIGSPLNQNLSRFEMPLLTGYH
jgi:hypothetical protein